MYFPILTDCKYKFRAPYTHFLNIPLATEPIRKNFDIFKEGITQNYQADGISAELFPPFSSLHLTIGIILNIFIKVVV